MSGPPINQFYDINKLPAQPGILLFYVSPSKIPNQQSADNCFEHAEHFTGEDSRIEVPKVGLNFIYGDLLYLHSDDKASDVRDSVIRKCHGHKQRFEKILSRNKWYIPDAFNHTTWSELILQAKDFFHYFGKLKKRYENDDEFQHYLQRDHERVGNGDLDDNQVNFFIEEILLFYLAAKEELAIYNEYVNRREEWLLNCYPGPPLLSEMYLFKENPFDLEAENPYSEAYYDLENNKLYEYDRVDLERIDFGGEE